MTRDYQTLRTLTNAAASDALAYFAPAEVILRAAASLEAGEFRSWDAEVSAHAARELRALAECYADTPEEAG
jgi:hypothetical protein